MLRRRQRRRGLALMIVLSLLVLFLLMGVSFMMVASQTEKGARAQAKTELKHDSPKRLLDMAMYDVLIGPRTNNSVIVGHGLLRDMYGMDGFTGEVQQVNNTLITTGQQFVLLRLPRIQDFDGNAHSLNVLSGYYNGRVLTIVSGAARGTSTRIVGYNYDPLTDTGDFLIMLPETDATANAQGIAAGDKVVVNGQPFSGTGFDYDDQNGTLDVQALWPNRHPLAYGNLTRYLRGQSRRLGEGGADESYDAPDLQNLAMAAIMTDRDPNIRGQMSILPSFHRPALINYHMANSSVVWQRDLDFRRGAILRPMPWDHPGFTGSNPAFTVFNRGATWTQGPDGAWGDVGIDDDSNGTTDDPSEAGAGDDVNSLLVGPWDVDNDNDGIPDSIWMDLGFAVQTNEPGRMYKPLFAILCLDMDGKLNLNAHGNRWHFATSPQKTTETLAGGTASSTLPTGEGYGPAEINLSSVFNNTEYQRLLAGDATFPGRYGDDQRAGIGGLDPFGLVKFFEYPDNYFTPTFTSFSTPANLEGRLAFGLDSRGLLRYERSTLTDNRIDAAYEIDLSAGAPVGYSATASTDQPFSAAELESLLRSRDLDARELPSRLRHLLSNTINPPPPASGHPDLARIITTDSYDLPVPNVTETPQLRQWRRSVNDVFDRLGATPQVRDIQFGFERLSDFIAVRILYQDLFPGGAFDPTRIDTSMNGTIEIGEAVPKLLLVNTTIQTMLAPDLAKGDLAKGTRLDINRPFGNGDDDNNNGVIDEHHWQNVGSIAANSAINESFLDERIWNTVLPARFDHDNDGTVGPPGSDTDAFLARHQMAKHLYVLLMTFKDRNHQIDFDNNGSSNAEETTRGIAQWCINVVDFRDADSIMTPFEYDIDPFSPDPGSLTNAWNVDGVIGPHPVTGSADDNGPQRRLVWGCERPEVLISETIAWHDRRTEDLDTAGPGADRKTTATNNPDNDFDQRLLPQGAFFVELYNPWKGDDRFPRELYHNSIPGVELSKVNRFGTPVWRIIIAKGQSRHGDPDMHDPNEPGYSTNRRLSPADVDRGIYFTDLSAAGIQTGISGHGMPFYPNDFITQRIAPLLPGRYAVVGSSGVETPPAGTPATYVSPVGRRTDADEMLPDLKIPDTRQVMLRLPPAASPSLTLDGCLLLNNQTQGGVDQPDPARLVPAGTPPTFNKQPVVGIPINMPRSFSVSEPVNGYQPTGANMIVPHPSTGEPTYSPPIDEPRDASRPGEQALLNNGTTADYCTVHLQRLSNPLAPWHAKINPYLTIDSMSSDLTAFNGVTNDRDPNAQGRRKHLATLERGEDDADPLAQPNSHHVRQLWKHEQAHNAGDLVDVPAGSGDPHYFDYELQSTFGYLNENYGPIFNPNVSDPRNGFPESSVIAPFPWLQWNNRPFASQYELTSVPRSKSYRLPQDYTVYSNFGNDLYRVTPSAFGHLLNFFETSDVSNNPNNAAHFYRLFDYTHVPSRFLGTETWLNPTHFQSGAGTDGWRAPFNGVPEFREPGKVNINTIYDQRVWTAITRGHPAPNFAQVVKSRRGYDPNPNGILRFSPNMPTFFTNPFRGAGERFLVPPVTNFPRRFGVETTLSRSNSVPAAPNLQGPRPLLERASTNPYDDSRRNPYFRHQPPTRLANLVTTRSNVYAIWITVGFFEVNPASGRLGQELGSDTGEVKRHRAFYMIDRSIPVAYQPGENHNVDRAVLVRRFIE